MDRCRFVIIPFLLGISIAGYGQVRNVPYGQVQSVPYGQMQSVPDSLTGLFNEQLHVFPQEKVYVHTDKPYYISGEKIWFRAYIADAVSHRPAGVSRYVYAELINPLDSVVTRVKIRPEREAYYGHLLIPDDAPEGDYTLRAFTHFMQNLEEEYLFTKTVRIGDPQASVVNTEVSYQFASGRRVYATFKFTFVGSSVPIVPKSVKVRLNNQKAMDVEVERDGTATVSFNLPANAQKRVVMLEVTAEKFPYRQFIQLPLPDTDFDVSFYPEGGALLEETVCKVAFKAMKSDGGAEKVSGVLYHTSGTEICSFDSEHLGMGCFSFFVQSGERYYALFKNEKGESKRFELPVAATQRYGLSVNWLKESLYISPRRAGREHSNADEELYLFAHTRGVVQYVFPFEPEKDFMVLPKELFPSGVLHLVLFDAHFNPLSERLVFVHHDDQAQVAYQSDQAHYEERALVQNSVAITDPQGAPISGSFSVAVTSDREVTPNFTSTICTQMLLASDLRGHIENPAYYFQNTPESARALDLLMLTQGWRRYNVQEWARGRFAYTTYPLEVGSELSGTVKSVLVGRPVEGIDVFAVSLKGNINRTQTDSDGRFWLSIEELPDSTYYLVSVDEKRGMTRMNLILDAPTFPERSLSVAPPPQVERAQFAQYVNSAEMQYIYEGGIRVVQLPEAVVIADRVVRRTSQMYTSPSAVISQETLENCLDIVTALNLVSGVNAGRDAEGNIRVLIRGVTSIFGESKPLLVVNDVVCDLDFLDSINIHDIAQIDILKAGAGTIFGAGASNGVIVIFFKDAGSSGIHGAPIPPFHCRTVAPLGFQKPVEFYAPKYETTYQRNNPKPDLRTTIHWQPVVQTDSLGVASFSFYTADRATSDQPTTYTVIMEGLANDGTLIRQEGKIVLP